MDWVLLHFNATKVSILLLLLFISFNRRIFRQIHMILAQAMYNGPKLVKKVVLEMAGSRMFPIDHVTQAMADMQHVTQTGTPTKNNQDQVASNMCFPVMSVTKIERLDEVITELKVQ